MELTLIADEVTALGWRLIGARVLLPGVDSVQDCWREALRSADLVLITASTPPLSRRRSSAAALLAEKPLVLVIADLRRRHEPPDDRARGAARARSVGVNEPGRRRAIATRAAGRGAGERSRRPGRGAAAAGHRRSRSALRAVAGLHRRPGARAVRSARKEARANVREAIVARAQACRASAAAGTGERRPRSCGSGSSRRPAPLLQDMWAAIGGVFEARWADAACRKSWLQAAVRQAQGC